MYIFTVAFILLYIILVVSSSSPADKTKCTSPNRTNKNPISERESVDKSNKTKVPENNGSSSGIPKYPHCPVKTIIDKNDWCRNNLSSTSRRRRGSKDNNISNISASQNESEKKNAKISSQKSPPHRQENRQDFARNNTSEQRNKISQESKGTRVTSPSGRSHNDQKIPNNPVKKSPKIDEDPKYKDRGSSPLKRPDTPKSRSGDPKDTDITSPTGTYIDHKNPNDKVSRICLETNEDRKKKGQETSPIKVPVSPKNPNIVDEKSVKNTEIPKNVDITLRKFNKNLSIRIPQNEWLTGKGGSTSKKPNVDSEKTIIPIEPRKVINELNAESKEIIKRHNPKHGRSKSLPYLYDDLKNLAIDKEINELKKRNDDSIRKNKPEWKERKSKENENEQNNRTERKKEKNAEESIEIEKKERKVVNYIKESSKSESEESGEKNKLVPTNENVNLRINLCDQDLRDEKYRDIYYMDTPEEMCPARPKSFINKLLKLAVAKKSIYPLPSPDLEDQQALEEMFATFLKKYKMIVTRNNIRKRILSEENIIIDNDVLSLHWISNICDVLQNFLLSEKPFIDTIASKILVQDVFPIRVLEWVNKLREPQKTWKNVHLKPFRCIIEQGEPSLWILPGFFPSLFYIFAAAPGNAAYSNHKETHLNLRDVIFYDQTRHHFIFHGNPSLHLVNDIY